MNIARRTIACRSLAALGAALLFAACAGDKSENTAQTSQAAPAQDTATPMAGMEGMGGSGIMQQMQTHMRMMDGAGADSIQAMLPVHRQTVANMIAQFNKDMRDMAMTSNTAWNATVDSLRQDLTRMPEMGGPELQQFMPSHRARVMRLMESHRTMMGTMKM